MLRLSLVMTVLSALWGCGWSAPSEATLKQAAEAHLKERYGADFVVEVTERPTVNIAPGGSSATHFGFGAHPVGAPETAFTGVVDTRTSPPTVSDTYACVQILGWLPDALAEALGPTHRVIGADLKCNKEANLPPYPVKGAPLPARSLRLSATVIAFVEGEPTSVAARTCEAYVREAQAFGVQARGRCAAVSPALADAPLALDALRGEEPTESVRVLTLADAPALEADGDPKTYQRLGEVEAKVTDVLRPHVGDARLSVWASAPTGVDASNIRQIDVRVGLPGLDLARMEAIEKALQAERGLGRYEVRGVDSAGPQEPPLHAFVCKARRCSEVVGPLLDPALVLEAGP